MDSCILWNKAKNKAGYGVTWANNKWEYAHRAIMNASKGQVVMHLCDNPSCVNPEHLKLGTHKENSQDAVSKKRIAFGERAGASKLTYEQVKEIRKEQGLLTSRQVAKKYKISKTNVLDIWKNYIWKKENYNE